MNPRPFQQNCFTGDGRICITESRAPKIVTQHSDSVSGSEAIRCRERAAERGRFAEDIEIVAGGILPHDGPRDFAPQRRRNERCVSQQPIEDAILVAIGFVFVD